MGRSESDLSKELWRKVFRSCQLFSTGVMKLSSKLADKTKTVPNIFYVAVHGTLSLKKLLSIKNAMALLIYFNKKSPHL